MEVFEVLCQIIFLFITAMRIKTVALLHHLPDHLNIVTIDRHQVQKVVNFPSVHHVRLLLSFWQDIATEC